VSDFTRSIFIYLFLLFTIRATAGLDKFHGKGSNGGVWEWTANVFDTHEGLVPTQLFTG
jgi:L-histidine Nalpha-methyltransferase / hercynylcysteine S-oxide synthase